MTDWKSMVFDSDLRGSDRAVALALANSSGPNGASALMLEVIAKRAGLGKRQTQRVLANLVDAGIVTRARSIVGPPVYTLQADRLAERAGA
jgi:DNA-binding IclR family transcriptional regulator